MKKTLIIFDIDGTIADTLHLDDDLYFGAFTELYGFEVKEEEKIHLKNMSSGTDSGLFTLLFKSFFHQNPGQKEIQDFKNLFISSLYNRILDMNGSIKEIPGVSKLINILSCFENLELAIATGSWLESAELKLKALKLDYSKFNLGHADMSESRTEIINYVIGSCKNSVNNFNFDKIIYFGDGEWDLKASTDTKIDFIGVDFYRTGYLESLGVKHIIHDFFDIPPILNIINC